jgi:predicted ATP-dependent protease
MLQGVRLRIVNRCVLLDKLLSRTDEKHRKLVLFVAQKLAKDLKLSHK